MSVSTMSRLFASAESRVAEVPEAPQRYGLSVFLRKPYPDARTRSADQDRPSLLRLEGADVRRVSWDEISPASAQRLQERVAEDTLTAFHVLHSAPIHLWRTARGETREVVLEHLVTPGVCTTLVIDVAPESSIIVRERSRPAAGPAGSAVVLLNLGEGARVQWFSAFTGTAECAMVERLANLQANASLTQHAALIGTQMLRDETHAVLAAPGASVKTNLLFVGAKEHQGDLGMRAEHRAPHTVSDLRAKVALAGKAQAVVRGLVRVNREAPGSDGYQRCDTLLLSPTAEVDPVPNLEIHTNDVRCTHGVTTGHLNPEHLFYVQSRGCSPKVARDLLVTGFLGTVLKAYPKDERSELTETLRRVVLEEA